jgi:type VI secretion system ImpB/VipA family protein
MAKESSQKWLKRNRPPRVQIQYEVEINGAMKKVELPFIMGVMADLSGSRKQALPDVKDRDFTEIDQDNFDAVLKAQMPTLQFQVPNTLTGEGKIGVDLAFEKMDDFSPAAVVEQVESLKKLKDARTQLLAFSSKLDGNFSAQDAVQKILADSGLQETIAGAGGGEEAAPAEEEEEKKPEGDSE